MMDGADFDWNLVRNFQALLVERNVTRAAERVGLTQPAMSRALARLRFVFDDELFIRSSLGMEPTPRALELAERVHRLCDELASLTQDSSFDPMLARETFTIVSADYSEWLMMPRLLAELSVLAPDCQVVFRRVVTRGQQVLDDYETDLLIGPRVPSRDSLTSQTLLDESFRTVVSQSHPRLAKTRRLSLAAFCKEGHVLVAPAGRPGGAVDDALAAQGKSRRVVARVPTFLVAPEIVAQSDLVATLPARLADAVAPRLGLRVFAPPLAVSGFTLRQIWHPRRNQDPAHVFLRQTLKRLCLGL